MRTKLLKWLTEGREPVKILWFRFYRSQAGKRRVENCAQREVGTAIFAIVDSFRCGDPGGRDSARKCRGMRKERLAAREGAKRWDPARQMVRFGVISQFLLG